MKIVITDTQYWALMDIYGPPANVHLMIMTSSAKGKKWVVEGDGGDFEDLLELIDEEVGVGLCSKANATHLLGVCKKINPGSLDWMGM